jgi:hypothetical protein
MSSTMTRPKPIPVKYVRFHNPVPNSLNSEPVYELKLDGAGKYASDKLSINELGLSVHFKGEVTLVPLANIAYVRPS